MGRTSALVIIMSCKTGGGVKWQPLIYEYNWDIVFMSTIGILGEERKGMQYCRKGSQ